MELSIVNSGFLSPWKSDVGTHNLMKDLALSLHWKKCLPWCARSQILHMNTSGSYQVKGQHVQVSNWLSYMWRRSKANRKTSIFPLYNIRIFLKLLNPSTELALVCHSAYHPQEATRAEELKEVTFDEDWTCQKPVASPREISQLARWYFHVSCTHVLRCSTCP